MPLYRIHITSSDGAIDSPDEQGIELTGIGEARALAVETLVEAAREPVPAGQTRTIRVTACDERGATVYGDAIESHGSVTSAETHGIWRAMMALNRAQTDPWPSGRNEVPCP